MNAELARANAELARGRVDERRTLSQTVELGHSVAKVEVRCRNSRSLRPKSRPLVAISPPISGSHAAAITSAAGRGVSVLVFPELSLTGYEPDLAAELAIEATDARLAPLAALARRHQIAVIVGCAATQLRDEARPRRDPACRERLGAHLCQDAPRG